MSGNILKAPRINMDLALNNLQWLICHKTKPNQQQQQMKIKKTKQKTKQNNTKKPKKQKRTNQNDLIWR